MMMQPMSNQWPSEAKVTRTVPNPGGNPPKRELVLCRACPCEFEVGTPRGIRLPEGELNLGNYTFTAPRGYVDFHDQDLVYHDRRTFVIRYPRVDGQEWICLAREQVKQQ